MPTMRRNLADGGYTGVTFSLREYASSDCSGDPSNAADAGATWNNFPDKYHYACIRRGSGSLSGHYCDVTTANYLYKGTRYPQSSDCSGTHQSYSYAADGSCVTAADGTSVRAQCSVVAKESGPSTSAVVIFAIGFAVSLCLAMCIGLWCLRRLRKDAQERQRDRQLARAAAQVVQVEPPARTPALPEMTSIM